MADIADAAVTEYLHAHEQKGLLRFITCGSVDDGKSTLIGRLLHDSHLILEDQMRALEQESSAMGAGEGIDLSLIVDGLAAEREQGITIDVAYRFFTTDRRRFIVADTPGHIQYTRNMATGASTADLAVILVDARKGLLSQTRRHSYIVALMGVRDVVLAVNKMDLVDFSRDVFEAIVTEYGEFAREIGIEGVTSVPISAKLGDNVVKRSPHTPWYEGRPLLEILETLEPGRRLDELPFRLSVQWVNRPNPDFRGLAGTVESGAVRVGDGIVAEPSGRKSYVSRIVTFDGNLDVAVAGQAVTLLLSDEIDVSRGDMLCPEDRRCEVADQFAAHVVWMSDKALMPGRDYWFRIATAEVNGRVTKLRYKVDVNNLEHEAATHLDLNEIGFCNVALDRAVPFDPYAENRGTGAFVMIDRMNNATVAAGMIKHALHRASNLFWQAEVVDRDARARLMGQKPCILWFTGLSGAGKSTIANLVEKRLHEMGRHTFMLDGDNVRHGLNRDLGFTEEDRVENIRRVAEVAKLMVDAGLIVLCSFISPFRSERRMARSLVAEGEFIEVFVDAPLDVCAARDPKGLYKKAREGKIPNFTGVDSPYERPENPEIVLDTARRSAEELAEEVVALLDRRT